MKKILLICFDNLGDLVFTSIIARALASEPDFELNVWCKDYTARIGYLLPGIKRVYAADPFWDKAPRRRKGSLRAFLRTWLSIKRSKFDTVFIPSTCWRAALFARLAGIPQRIGIEGKRNLRFLTHWGPCPRRDEPVVAGLLQAFRAFLPSQASPFYYLERQRLPRLELPSALKQKSIAVLHPFAGRSDRCAPLEIWEKLAVKLKSHGYFIMWTGMSDELRLLRQKWPEIEAKHFIDSWALDLEKLAWFWSQAEVFIGHDSGPLHVAHALGVPVLGLYLPGEPRRTFPQGSAQSKIYHAASPAAIDDAELLGTMELFIQTIKTIQKTQG